MSDDIESPFRPLRLVVADELALIEDALAHVCGEDGALEWAMNRLNTPSATTREQCEALGLLASALYDAASRISALAVRLE